MTYLILICEHCECSFARYVLCDLILTQCTNQKRDDLSRYCSLVHELFRELVHKITYKAALDQHLFTYIHLLLHIRNNALKQFMNCL